MRARRSQYELLPQASSELDDFGSSSPSWLAVLGSKIPVVNKLVGPYACARYIAPRRRKRSALRLLYRTLFALPYLVVFLVLFVGAFFPSYTHRPAHYNDLRRRALANTIPGRANPNNEKVFIAAAVYEDEGSLTAGAWGQSVLELVDLLGPQNVHLSIYENDPDAVTRQSLLDFKDKVTSNSTIVMENLDLGSLPRVTLPNGDTRIKRIAFLAEVRNRALAPLDNLDVSFDKLLYVNDVNFDPIDAAQLLLSTNIDSSGRTNYDAACAVDFINPFKFYDRFATRDMDGGNMGIPFYPWFTSAGSGTSRQDVLAGTDAVRVRSCWGGMTAFDAKLFQDRAQLARGIPQSTSELQTSPVRFRYDPEPFWESSECCLVHADIQYRRSGVALPADSGIYMNPFIRVAYDTKTLSWLSLTRRPERLYAVVHDILNRIIGLPLYNPRQSEEPGQNVTDTLWEYSDPSRGLLPNATAEDKKGHYQQVERLATPGGFCSGRQLLVINENPQQGEGRWGKIFAPAPA